MVNFFVNLSVFGRFASEFFKLLLKLFLFFLKDIFSQSFLEVSEHLIFDNIVSAFSLSHIIACQGDQLFQIV